MQLDPTSPHTGKHAPIIGMQTFIGSHSYLQLVKHATNSTPRGARLSQNHNEPKTRTARSASCCFMVITPDRLNRMRIEQDKMVSNNDNNSTTIAFYLDTPCRKAKKKRASPMQRAAAESCRESEGARGQISYRRTCYEPSRPQRDMYPGVV